MFSRLRFADLAVKRVKQEVKTAGFVSKSYPKTCKSIQAFIIFLVFVFAVFTVTTGNVGTCDHTANSTSAAGTGTEAAAQGKI